MHHTECGVTAACCAFLPPIAAMMHMHLTPLERKAFDRGDMPPPSSRIWKRGAFAATFGDAFVEGAPASCRGACVRAPTSCTPRTAQELTLRVGSSRRA